MAATVGQSQCREPGCKAISAPPSDSCIAHADAASRQLILDSSRQNGVVQARGVEFTPELLDEVIQSASHADDGEMQLQGFDFRGATFRGPTDFSPVAFVRNVVFDDAEFERDVSFAGLVFVEDVSFKGARFAGRANFSDSRFERQAHFFGARFEGSTDFAGCVFHDQAWFADTSFDAAADFASSQFNRIAVFVRAEFHGETRFRETRFRDTARFQGAAAKTLLDFQAAKFTKAALFESSLIGSLDFRDVEAERGITLSNAIVAGQTRFARARLAGRVEIDYAVFERPLRLKVQKGSLDAEGTSFQGGALFYLDKAAADLTRTRFGAPSLIYGDDAEAAKLDSLAGADVENVRLSMLDFSDCSLEHAHNLDKMQIAETVHFDHSPGRPWTRRAVIKEERIWRRHGRRQGHWGGPTDVAALPPGEIAALYRSLRKGFEDSSNEPGAADFYYGEMEMRRHDDRRGIGERILLFLYWLSSGYGLRASRALVFLAVTVAVFSVLLWQWGFDTSQTYVDAALFSVEGTTSLFARDRTEALTTTGEAMWLALRLLGPILFALAILSMRSRVRR